MTISSLHSNGLHCHQMSFQQSWDVAERELLIIDVQPTTRWWYHESIFPKSLKNLSSTLLNRCHEELRYFWRPAVYSKVYLWVFNTHQVTSDPFRVSSRVWVKFMSTPFSKNFTYLKEPKKKRQLNTKSVTLYQNHCKFHSSFLKLHV